MVISRLSVQVDGSSENVRGTEARRRVTLLALTSLLWGCHAVTGLDDFIAADETNVGGANAGGMGGAGGQGGMGGQVDCAPIPTSCFDVLRCDPTAADGRYEVDFDGDGVQTPIDVHCDMEGGGWTLVLNQPMDEFLPAVENTVNPASVGTTNAAYRIGGQLIKTVRPTTAWLMTDESNDVYIQPDCIVDYGVNYRDQPQHTCTTGFSDIAFTMQKNPAFENTGVWGIGINNLGQDCSIRAYSDPQGWAATCLNDQSAMVRLWFK